MKTKYLIVLIFSVFCGAVLQAQTAQYFLAEERLIVQNDDSIYTVKVYAKSDVEFKLGAGQLYFVYDTTVFGSNVVQNDVLDIIIDSTYLLGEQIQSGPFSIYGQFITNDNTADRFSFSWQSNFSDGCLVDSNLNVYITKLFEIQIPLNEGTADVSSAVCFEQNGPYIDQTYTICGPQNCDVSNCVAYPGLRLAGDIYSCEDCRIVTKVSDFGLGSLRMAMECAGPGDSVLFDGVVNNQVIELDTPIISTPVSISLYAQNGQNITITSLNANNESTLIETFDILKFSGLNLIGKPESSLIFEAKGNGGFEFERSLIDKANLKTP